MKLSRAAIWLMLILSVRTLPVPAQAIKRVAVTSYNIDNGLLQNTVSNLAVDKFGFVWFSTASGVQRFDGSHFETVNFNEDSIAFHAAQLTVLRNEEIWISHSKGITAFNPETNRSRSVLKSPPPRSNYLYHFIGEDVQTAWFISYPDALLQFDKKSGQLLTKLSFPTFLNPLDESFHCRQVDEHYAIIQAGQALAVFSLASKKIMFRYVDNNRITGFVPYSNQRLIFTTSKGYYSLDMYTGEKKFIRSAKDEEPPNVSFASFLNKEGNLVTANEKNICEIDTTNWTVKTKWVAYNQDNLINSGGIYNLYADKFDRLWIMTNSDGVKRVALNKPAFQYYGTAEKKVNFIRSIYTNKEKGIVLAGTFGSGLLVFDTSGHLLQKISNNNIKTITDIEYLGNDKYLLLAMGYQTLHLFDRKNSTVTQLFLPNQKNPAPHCSYYGSLQRLPDSSFVFTDHGIFRFSVKNKQVTDTATIRNDLPWIYNFFLLKNGSYCLVSEKGVEITGNNFRQKSFLPFAQRVMVRCVAEDSNGFIWVGSESGLYKISGDNKLLKKYMVADGLADEIIYSIEPAKNGIYFSHNKGLSFLSHEARLVHYNRYSGLQENEFNSRASFQTNDGEIFFGGINGISSFYPSALTVAQTLPAVYITALQVMDKPWKDTAVWNIKAISVPFDANRVAIRIGIPASAGKGYVYEYKMTGLEPDWITTSGTDFIRYVLPPGNYNFRVRISNGKEGGPSETTLQITVAAPFWQTTWFKIALASLIVGLIALAVQRYSRHKYLKKIRQLEIEHQLQLERERISRDLHDNLGAYASAIADNVEKLSKKPSDERRLITLKENAAEIMTNLRDTIWALNKKEISVLTLSDRIKSFLQKMREAFPAVEIILEEDLSADAMLSPELALNILRIVQEALHNSIKHSGGNQIFILLHINAQLHISVRDNGKGLGQINGNGGGGLQNMKARAEENNLQLQINSTVEKGTSVELFSKLQ